VRLLQSGEGASDWAAALKAAMRKQTDRPRSLLVFLNPFGGARQAQSVWDTVASPIMQLAGLLLQLPSGCMHVAGPWRTCCGRPDPLRRHSALHDVHATKIDRNGQKHAGNIDQLCFLHVSPLKRSLPPM